MQETLVQAYAQTILSFGLEEPPFNTTTLLMQVVVGGTTQAAASPHDLRP
jgi:hypothetical protein